MLAQWWTHLVTVVGHSVLRSLPRFVVYSEANALGLSIGFCSDKILGAVAQCPAAAKRIGLARADIDQRHRGIDRGRSLKRGSDKT